ncbi:MAG: 5'/3'-nucleotidase SurE [Phycisphaerae bacterium]
MSNQNPEQHPERLVVPDEQEQRSAAPPRLLLTNDDGIESPGLRLLAQHLATRHDLVVVAPDGNRSGAGTGIGRFDPHDGVALRSAPLDGVEAYSIDGPPGLAVMAGVLGGFGRKPDLIVSGVNAGMNTGHSVIHSGTVGAALTARTFGADGLAISLGPSEPWHWETAVEIAGGVVEWMLKRRSDSKFVLNVNVPAVPITEIKGVRWAKLDEFGYFRVAMADEPGERLQFEVASADSGRHPECDTAQCFDRYVTLTPLTAIEAEPFPQDDAAAVCAWSNGR